MKITNKIIAKIDEKDNETIILVLNNIVKNENFTYDKEEAFDDVKIKAFEQTVAQIKSAIEDLDNNVELQPIDLNEDIIERAIAENQYPNAQDKKETQDQTTE